MLYRRKDSQHHSSHQCYPEWKLNWKEMWKFVISINFKLSYLSKHIIEIYSLSNGKRQETSVNSWLNRPPSKPDELPQMPPEEPPPVEPPVSPPVTSVTPSVTPEPSVKPPVTSVSGTRCASHSITRQYTARSDITGCSQYEKNAPGIDGCNCDESFHFAEKNNTIIDDEYIYY